MIDPIDPTENNDQRREPRVSTEFIIMIRIGSQISVRGQLKDISLSSAFIKIKSSVFLKTGDEVRFAIQSSPDDAAPLMQGLAHISRIEPGEGFAIYFSKMDDASLKYLKEFLKKSGV